MKLRRLPAVLLEPLPRRLSATPGLFLGLLWGIPLRDSFKGSVGDL